MDKRKLCMTIMYFLRNGKRIVKDLNNEINSCIFNKYDFYGDCFDTEAQCEKILECIEIKKRLYSLKDAVSLTLNKMDAKLGLLLYSRFYKPFFWRKYKQTFKIPRTSCKRYFRKAVKVFLSGLNRLGYSEKCFEKEYMTILQFRSLYDSIM